MKIIHIAGYPRSGKTTVMLNIRLAFNVLFKDDSNDNLTQCGKVLFVGPGLDSDKYKRLVGTDVISQNEDLLNIFMSGLSLHYPEDTILIVDSYIPIFNNFDVSKHECIVRFCMANEQDFAARSKQPEKRAEDYIEGQEALLEGYSKDSVDFKIWDDDTSLEGRVTEILRLLGSDRQPEKVVTNFKRYWNDLDLEDSDSYDAGWPPSIID